MKVTRGILGAFGGLAYAAAFVTLARYDLPFLVTMSVLSLVAGGTWLIIDGCSRR